MSQKQEPTAATPQASLRQLLVAVCVSVIALACSARGPSTDGAIELPTIPVNERTEDNVFLRSITTPLESGTYRIITECESEQSSEGALVCGCTRYTAFDVTVTDAEGAALPLSDADVLVVDDGCYGGLAEFVVESSGAHTVEVHAEGVGRVVEMDLRVIPMSENVDSGGCG